MRALVDKLCAFTDEYDVEFVLVENGSKDNSRKLFLTYPEFDGEKIKSVFVNNNQGYGYGLLQGLAAATGDYVGWVHADMQLPLEELVPFMNYACEYCSSAPLFMKGIRTNRSLVEHIFTAGMSIFESLLFQVYVFDIGAIPVLFDRRLIPAMNAAPYDFAIELFAYVAARKKRFHIYRRRVYLTERKAGKSSWNTGFLSRIRQSMRIIKASIGIRVRAAWKVKI